jgi:disulfide oxidoreductase YuzD
MEVQDAQVILEVLVLEDMEDQAEEVQMTEDGTKKDMMTVEVETDTVVVADGNVKLKDL